MGEAEAKFLTDEELTRQAKAKRVYPWLQLLLVEKTLDNETSKLVVEVMEGGPSVAEIYDRLLAMDRKRNDARKEVMELIYDQLHLIDTAAMNNPYDRDRFESRQRQRRATERRQREAEVDAKHGH